MPIYTITDSQTGRTLDVRGAGGPPTQEEAAALFAANPPPFDVKAQNATMRRNMSAQSDAANRPPESEFTGQKIVDRGLQGLKGEAEGFAGGLAGLAATPYVAYQALRHPMATASSLGTGAAALVGLAQQAVDDPAGALAALKDQAVKFGADPESIGMAAGGLDAALAAPTITRAARGTRLGQAVTTGLSEAANRVPGVKAARSAWNASAPLPEAPPAAPSEPMEWPLDLTRRLKAENVAKAGGEAAAKEQAFGHVGPIAAKAAPLAAAAEDAPAVVIPASVSRTGTVALKPADRTTGQMSETWISSDVGMAARRLKVELTPEMRKAAADLVTSGNASPLEAVAKIAQPATDPAELLRQKLGLPSPDDVAARLASRKRTGRWPEGPNGKQILAKRDVP